MSELQITPALVGKQVESTTRPDWGSGRVLKVVPTQHQGQAAHRVQVHFEISGTRWLMIPPAKLRDPQAETEREAGWLDSIGGMTVDDRLKSLPSDVTEVLGDFQQRLAAVVPLYALNDDPKVLQKWAMKQTGVADPLRHWTRDELTVAFRAFCMERDSFLKNLLAQYKIKYGPEGVRSFLKELPPAIRANVDEALGRVI